MSCECRGGMRTCRGDDDVFETAGSAASPPMAELSSEASESASGVRMSPPRSPYCALGSCSGRSWAALARDMRSGVPSRPSGASKGERWSRREGHGLVCDIYASIPGGNRDSPLLRRIDRLGGSVGGSSVYGTTHSQSGPWLDADFHNERTNLQRLAEVWRSGLWAYIARPFCVASVGSSSSATMSGRQKRGEEASYPHTHSLGLQLAAAHLPFRGSAWQQVWREGAPGLHDIICFVIVSTRVTRMSGGSFHEYIRL